MVTDANEQARNKINACLKQGRQLYKAKVKLDRVIATASFKNTSGSAGWNETLGWYIKLSKKDLDENLDYMLTEIIPHEVAHIICMWLHINDMPMGDAGHGNNWRTVAKALGSSGETKPLSPKFKHSYKTEGGTLVKVSDDQHNDMQQHYRRYKTKHGEYIAAAHYQKQ